MRISNRKPELTTTNMIRHELARLEPLAAPAKQKALDTGRSYDFNRVEGRIRTLRQELKLRGLV